MQLAAKVKGSFAIASHLPAPIPDRANSAFVSAMHVSLLAAAAAALLAALGVTVLLARNAQVTYPTDEPAVEFE